MANTATTKRRPESSRSGTISIRVRPAVRSLIDQAAAAQGKSRSDFMLDASRHAAEEALLDRAVFHVDARTYDRFVALLDAPAKPNARLRKLLHQKAPWD
jgi:uncharacterized protein (DUF1778 family)